MSGGKERKIRKDSFDQDTPWTVIGGGGGDDDAIKVVAETRGSTVFEGARKKKILSLSLSPCLRAVISGGMCAIVTLRVIPSICCTGPVRGTVYNSGSSPRF